LPVYCLVTTKVRADHVVLSTTAQEEALQMDRVVRFFRIVAVLAVPAAVLFVTTGNHVQGL
jgi:hypothetical protein